MRQNRTLKHCIVRASSITHAFSSCRLPKVFNYTADLVKPALINISLVLFSLFLCPLRIKSIIKDFRAGTHGEILT